MIDRVYDSTHIPSIPADAAGVVCYMDRRFKNDAVARSLFPHLDSAGRIVTLTAGMAPADGIDIEPGNAGPEKAGSWFHQQHALGAWRPLFYADRSDMVLVVANLHHSGVAIPPPGPDRPVRLLSAHPNGVRHVCGPQTCGFPVEMDGTQYAFSPGGLNVDVSAVRDDFFRPAPAPPPQPPTPRPPTPAQEGDDMITAVVKQDGRLEVFVEKADTGEVFHAYQTAKDSGWTGGEPNVRTAQWYSLGTPGK